MRKLLAFWQAITFRWMDVSKQDPKKYLEVLPINETAEMVGEALGITEERNKEIVDICIKSFNDTTKLTDAIALASKEAKHANELSYMTYILIDIKHTTNNPLLAIMRMHAGPQRGE